MTTRPRPKAKRMKAFTAWALVDARGNVVRFGSEPHLTGARGKWTWSGARGFRIVKVRVTEVAAKKGRAK